MGIENRNPNVADHIFFVPQKALVELEAINNTGTNLNEDPQKFERYHQLHPV